MIKTTPVQKSDFDQKAFRLLDALNEKGRAEEAWELDILAKGQSKAKSQKHASFIFLLFAEFMDLSSFSIGISLWIAV